jgi:Family of unknown function (DUF5995)
MVDGVQRELAQVWPAFALLDRVVGNIDEAIAQFKIGKARDEAWRLAQRLAPLDESGQAGIIGEVDESVSFLSRLMRRPGIAGSAAFMMVRLGERGTVPEIRHSAAADGGGGCPAAGLETDACVGVIRA